MGTTLVLGSRSLISRTLSVDGVGIDSVDFTNEVKDGHSMDRVWHCGSATLARGHGGCASRLDSKMNHCP